MRVEGRVKPDSFCPVHGCIVNPDDRAGNYEFCRCFFFLPPPITARLRQLESGAGI